MSSREMPHKFHLAPPTDAPSINVELETTQAQWGRPITGRVVLTAGDEYVRVSYLRVRLIEQRLDVLCGDDAVPPRLGAVHALIEWDSNFWLEPHQQREWPFTLKAPWDGDFEHFWMVQGTLRLVEGACASNLARFKLGPPPLFEAAAATVTKLVGLPVAGWTFQAPWAYAEFPANAEWGTSLQRLVLRLQRERSHLVGEVQAVLPEGRGGRRLRSAVLLAAHPARFRVPKHELSAAARALQAALEPLLLEQARALHGTDDLPLPASAVLDVELLPGPSQAGPLSGSQEH
jgi:hypothetical protein